MITKIWGWICVLVFLLPVVPEVVAEDSLSLRQVLTHCDRARGNLEGVRWTVEIQSSDKGNKETRQLDVKARGYDFLALTLTPPKVKGHKLLMVDHNMWFAKPDLSKPIPISPRQKLVGGASYGDIAATNYADDYAATLQGEEVLNGEPCYVLDLKAAHKKVTYDRITYWVSKDRLVGVQAHYFTLSGKLFKRAWFEYQHHVNGPQGTHPFISKMTIREEISPDAVTILLFAPPELKTVEPETFDLNLFMSR